MSWEVFILRAALIVPPVIVVARADFEKYRFWRERCKRWRADGRTPPKEYRRDNRLWRIRLAALGFAAVAYGVLLVFALSESDAIRRWEVLVLLPVSALLGAGIWVALGEYVR